MEEIENNTDWIVSYNRVLNNFKEILVKHNVTMADPSIIVADFPFLEKNNIKLRKFKSPYINKDDEVGGNLYRWLHQDYSVLWEANTSTNEVILFSKTNEKLGLRFATLLKMDKTVAINGFFFMSITMALSELCWEHIVKNIEFANDNPSGKLLKKLKREFSFYLTKLVNGEDFENQRILARFITMFGEVKDLKNNI